MYLLVEGGMVISSANATSNFFENNLEIYTLKNESLKNFEEKKINRSLFLPVLSLIGGEGYEKSIDKNKVESGPFLYLDGSLNIYRGGRDFDLTNKLQINLSKNILDKEKATRKLKVETYKILSEIKTLNAGNKLILTEMKENKSQQSMAQKKVTAGLNTNVDLLDFEIKDQNLNNLFETNKLKIESLSAEIKLLYGNKYTENDIEKEFDFNLESSLVELKTILNVDDTKSITVQYSKLNAESVLIDKRIIHSEYFPTVDLETKWGQINPQANFLKNEKEYQILLSINFPLYTGSSTSSKENLAILETETRLREGKQVELENSSNREISYKKIERTKQLLQSFELILSRAKKYKELTINEYRRGIKNSPDVISASDKYFEVLNKITETKSDLMILIYSFNENFKPL
jgi:outer membrane protein TolC